MAKFVTLIILDGFGYNPKKEGNAVALANTPFWDYLWETYPRGLLAASGEAVGLPEGQMGNSEVGHMNIGSGRIVWQDIVRITKSIKSGEFFENPVIEKAIETAKKKGKKLHLIGLLSDGGVHSYIEHLFALLEFAKKKELEKVCVHAILDGRDTPPKSAEKYLRALIKKVNELGIGKIATMGGRYYYMDRDKRWDRTEKAYDALVLGEGLRCDDPIRALFEAYEREETDEFVKPYVISPDCLVEDGDVLFFYNFRADRMRQIVSALAIPEFNGFERKKVIKPSYVATMTLYDETFPFDIAYPPQDLKNVLGEVISNLGYKQLRIAETEKYAHVTYFFNGGKEEPFKGEERILVPSPKVSTYDKKPEMSAYEVTDKVVERIENGDYKLIVLNYANPDMVGHTGNLEAAINAIETVDKCLKKVVKATLMKGGTCIVTADHGNAEQMIDPETGNPWTAHTTNFVPFVVITGKCGSFGVKRREKQDVELPSEFDGIPVIGILGDIAPSILYILGEKIPPEMTGDVIVKGS
ncbi:2,3-bisphosphoglycerate-independent phosphoglycerate mutase [Desulfurobacterium thermolithotrophum DSM 11699]|uniref:2,3-bisphosphoglycerate-independent phosphoglycerate mutase n=1 Tax=Desulfurobacterium thermolithotrophum (strain DSM 11699 / BSA) TaxID=868864 RepID=F0S308_DESTD|nr:2,3-bisphosphoglycerate-independent phosphoglycerate mutase [Desulfurobacterium thermolithotrophum]ADY73230.1 2,3-bisphosphoglycerate-independent phosphoglycerate mutase [Desulfurobacterium thermolithotrophum DSM 11699]